MAKYRPLYAKSHALLIGIDGYASFPQLSTAVKGVRELAQVLQDEFDFERSDIITLEDEAATRRNIRRALTDPFSRRDMVGPDDRVIIYFAGHGVTIDTAAGEVGFIVPVDSESGYEDTLIAMDELTQFAAQRIHAKHVLFLLDTCFSGFATTRLAPGTQRQLEDYLTLPTRQVISAGTRDQQVSDLLGPGGHSLFTGFLLDGLRGAAPMPGGVLRTFHVAGYLQDAVASNSRSLQTPQYAQLMGSQGGDFIFAVREVDELPQWVCSAMNSHATAQRLVAIDQLRTLANAEDTPATARQALQALSDLAEHDSDVVVRSSAQAVLRELMPQTKVAPLVREEPVVIEPPPPEPQPEAVIEEQEVMEAQPPPEPALVTAPGRVPPFAEGKPQSGRRSIPALIGGGAVVGIGIICLGMLVGILALAGVFNQRGTPLLDATEEMTQEAAATAERTEEAATEEIPEAIEAPAWLIINERTLAGISAEGVYSEVATLPFDTGCGADFSADGKRVAYFDIDPDAGIFVSALDGSDTQKIVDIEENPEGYYCIHISWSPDDTKIAYSSGDVDEWILHVVSLDGSAPEFTLPAWPSAGHDWSPSSDLIVSDTWPKFDEDLQAYNRLLFLVDLEGNVTQLTFAEDWEPCGYDFEFDYQPDNWLPDWSPTRDEIAFLNCDGDLYVTSLDGDIRQLATDAYGPRWTPDGNWIIFEPGSSRRGLVMVSRDGSTLMPIANSLEINDRFQVGPADGG